MALFQPPSRVESVDQRIKDSDKFPRIEEAMLRIRKQKEKKEKELMGGGTKPKKTKAQILVEEAKKEVEQSMEGYTRSYQYFNTFVVNDNPDISKVLCDVMCYDVA
jgi:hypothetical protein